MRIHGRIVALPHEFGSNRRIRRIIGEVYVLPRVGLEVIEFRYAFAVIGDQFVALVSEHGCVRRVGVVDTRVELGANGRTIITFHAAHEGE